MAKPEAASAAAADPKQAVASPRTLGNFAAGDRKCGKQNQEAPRAALIAVRQSPVRSLG